jgi:hypothetical protein
LERILSWPVPHIGKGQFLVVTALCSVLGIAVALLEGLLMAGGVLRPIRACYIMNSSL